MTWRSFAWKKFTRGFVDPEQFIMNIVCMLIALISPAKAVKRLELSISEVNQCEYLLLHQGFCCHHEEFAISFDSIAGSFTKCSFVVPRLHLWQEHFSRGIHLQCQGRGAFCPKKPEIFVLQQLSVRNRSAWLADFKFSWLQVSNTWLFVWIVSVCIRASF